MVLRLLCLLRRVLVVVQLHIIYLFTNLITDAISRSLANHVLITSINNIFNFTIWCHFQHRNRTVSAPDLGIFFHSHHIDVITVRDHNLNLALLLLLLCLFEANLDISLYSFLSEIDVFRPQFARLSFKLFCIMVINALVVPLARIFQEKLLWIEFWKGIWFVSFWEHDFHISVVQLTIFDSKLLVDLLHSLQASQERRGLNL